MARTEVDPNTPWWKPECVARRSADRARRRAAGQDISRDRSFVTWALDCLAQRLDLRWKRLDLESRTYTSLDPPSWRHHLVGHSPSILGITLILMLCLVNGPALDRGWFSIAFTLIAWGLLLVVHRTLGRTGRKAPHPRAKGISWVVLCSWIVLIAGSVGWDVHPVWTPVAALLLGTIGCLVIPRGIANLAWFAVILLAAAATWWGLADETRLAASGAPYRHVLLPLILAVAFFGLVFNPWWAWFLFADRRKRYRAVYSRCLHKAQLFDPRIPARAKASDIVRAYAVAPIAQPLLLAVVPGILLLVLRRDEALRLLLPFFGEASEVVFLTAAALVYLAWWSVVAMTVFHPRLDGLLSFLRTLFCRGAAQAVSILVVVFACARLLEVTYVTTILDSSARLITEPLLFLYATAWFYDYWTERGLNDALLGLLHPSDDLPDEVDYVPPDGRIERGARLLPHGATRWLVLRYTQDGRHHFNFYSPAEVFRRIVEPTRVQSVARRLLPRLYTQSRFYRPLAVVFFGLLLFAGWRHYLDPERFPRTYTLAADTDEVLAARTFPWESDPPRDELLFVAASGGGTRAALYTQAFLQALQAHGELDHVRVISSVSGGGWANAWFATWRDELLAEPLSPGAPLPPAWRAFRAGVLHPHIDEVLAGSFEWRLVRGYRLGELLQESFARQLRAPSRAGTPAPLARLDQSGSVGLIFNTSLAGFSASGRTSTAASSGENAGGRLVFTNLARLQPTGEPWAPDHAAPYVIVRDRNVSLAAAAAASANFPPVFSNLPVDLSEGTGAQPGRYWIVDGGAVENRGLVSLLYYLRSLPEETLARAHVAVVDVSGLSTGFSQTRGTAAALGAPRKLGTQLIAELTASLRRQPGGQAVRFYDLTLPRAMRTSFGTHWRMQKTVRVVPASEPIGVPNDDPPVELVQQDVETFFEELFLGQGAQQADGTGRADGTDTTDTADAVSRVWEWVRAEYAPTPRRPSGGEPPWEAFARLVRNLDEP